jgi:hypothetical protein
MFGGDYNHPSKESIKRSVGIRFSKEKSKRRKVDRKKIGVEVESFKPTQQNKELFE